jgi:uncharacterized repeat protein (TIGR03803 family)
VAQHRNWIFILSSRVVTATLAVAIVFVFTAALTQFAQAQTYTMLHSFSDHPDGANPFGGLTIDQAGNLYGTTESGGVFGGTAFKLTPKGQGWIFTVLYTFGSDGYLPSGRVVFGPAGALYGTTVAGGIGPCQGNGFTGCGTVFKLAPPATFCKAFSCPWTKTVLYSFTGGNDGANPYSDVVFDSAGNLYGTTAFGGGINCRQNDDRGCGTVYKLTPSNGSWTESVLHSFGGGDGMWPQSGVVVDQAGNLYGTTYYGGLQCSGGQTGCGTVWELMPGSSGWTEKVLHLFQGGSDGSTPPGALTFDQSGNLYGTALAAGATCGTLFELVPSNGTWTFSVAFDFACPDRPSGDLASDAVGDLYGPASGGAYGAGAVFKLTPSANGWTYTSLHDFDFSDGDSPYGSVVLGANGNVYGTTFQGGLDDSDCYPGCGVVWGITP